MVKGLQFAFQRDFQGQAQVEMQKAGRGELLVGRREDAFAASCVKGYLEIICSFWVL